MTVSMDRMTKSLNNGLLEDKMQETYLYISKHKYKNILEFIQVLSRVKKQMS